MKRCDKCGFPLPEDAEYCPNCGAPVRKTVMPTKAPLMSLDKILQAGVLGAFISVMIASLNSFGIQLYFIPSFISSILVIFLFRTKRLEEAVLIAFTVYLFADAILGGMMLGTLYLDNISLSEAYSGYELSFLDVVAYLFNPISAIIAAYIGNKITLGAKEERIGYEFKEEREEGGIIYSSRGDLLSHKI
ncbi:hypothetical protein DRO35_04945 [Candidatus Bathyarchaeota archaeon]|nr:MAG: hypothetical protein DRO35_04945 [Candidatus Bathyarchaeota archaeon]